MKHLIKYSIFENILPTPGGELRVRVSSYNNDADFVHNYLKIDELSNLIGEPFKKIEVMFDPVKIYWEDLHKLKIKK